MSEYKEIQRVLQRARVMCEALECTGIRDWLKSAAGAEERQSARRVEDPEFNQRFETLMAVEAMLGKLRRELMTANELLQNRFLREARVGALRKPH